MAKYHNCIDKRQKLTRLTILQLFKILN